MNTLIQRVVEVTGEWQSVTDRADEIATVEVLALPTNVAEVEFRGDRGEPVPWQPGEWHSFPRIDLRQLQVRGRRGDRITVVGGTW